MPQSIERQRDGRAGPPWRYIAPAGVALAAGTLAAFGIRRAMRASSPFPRDPAFDSTVPLLREGYTFISRRCGQLHTDVFETRLLGQRAFCLRGEEAARMFYVPDRLTRRGGLPRTALRLLQDFDSVQTLDGAAHRHRKALFIGQLMEPDAVARLVAEVRSTWNAERPGWERRRQIRIHDAMQALLCRAVCRWAGVPVSEAEARWLTRNLAATIESAGHVGPRNWIAQVRRIQLEHWTRGLVRWLRARGATASDGAAAAIASHRDLDGRELPEGVAAVEILNVLRPTVAIARFVTFAALALHRHPGWRDRLRRRDGPALEQFAQEVRRYYPFFPAVAGIVRTPFEWRGHRFGAGDWLVLDLYGTNHDPALWGDPDTFRPERFAARNPDLNALIPQGGGGYVDGHRCPGEPITIAILEELTHCLAKLDYDVPAQDLSVSLARMPALPASGMLIRLRAAGRARTNPARAS